MKIQSIFNKFESFIIRAQEAINTLQVKVGKDADEQAKITIKLANLHLASTYCKAVLVKNGYTPTDVNTLVAFNSASYEAKDLEGAPVLTNIDDVYTAYITFRALLAETDGFMYRMWVKTGTIVYASLHYVNKYTFRLVWNGMVWLWTKTKGFFTKAPVVVPETITTPEATSVVEATPEAPVVDSEALPEVSDDIIEELESDLIEEEALELDTKQKWTLVAKDNDYNIEAIVKAFYLAEGDNEELFSYIFDVTPEYVSKIFSAFRPVKKEVAGPKPATTSKKSGKSPKNG